MRGRPSQQLEERSKEGVDPWFLVLLGVLLAGAVALRVAAATGDLWLDEIWSLELALASTGFVDVISGIRLDNNHWLNTWFLHLVGEADHLILYRGLALATGAGTLLAVTLDGLRRGKGPALTAALLFGFSYMLIHFDSEARGYGPAAFFGIGSYFTLRAFLHRGRAAQGLAFAVFATLGVLSHLFFVWIYAGCFLWSLNDLRTRSGTVSSASGAPWVRTFTILHAAPASTLAALAVVDIRHWRVGGSPPTELLPALRNLVSDTLGVHGPGWLVLIVGVAAAVILGAEILRMFKRREPEAFFFLTAVIAGPAAVILVGFIHFFYPRYVLVSIPFALLLIARFLGRVGQARPYGPHVRSLLLVLFVLGNLVSYADFIEYGRGSYRAAVEHIVSASDEGEIRVGFPWGYWQDPVVEFYAARVAGGQRIHLLSPEEWERELPEWLLVQELDRNPPDPRASIGVADRQFVFEGRFRHRGGSGWTWDLYRAAGPPDVVGTTLPPHPKAPGARR